MKIRVPSSYEYIFEEQLDDLNGIGTVLVHKQSGARVAIIKNDDDNKVFSIGFRTPPANSTGVAHIIEHSVLCGSKNFPAKDPFVELVKGSLNTFLNAMTYPDKTIYPVASRNDKDLANLMHVYMDAVFYPNIYERREIFMQEGWHYDLESLDAELKYNGVVYNEMKGAFSSPEQQLFRMIQNSLFPDTSYGVESGGDPAFIPELSYEEFLDFHKTYYHPSNSYIYLYGDMDFEERLTWLDQEYLSKFNRSEVSSEIKYQKGFDFLKEVSAFYSLGENDDLKDNTYLSLNTVIGNSLNKELSLAFQVLEYVLLNAPGAPVKQALLDAGIGKDILSSYQDDIFQPIFTVVAKNTNGDKKEDFKKLIHDVLLQQVNDGLDEKSLRAAINFYEFRYREADFGQFPKGLMYGIRVMGSWLYDDQKPFLHLKDNEGFEFLKSKIGTGYYEQLIDAYLLNNPHSTLVMLQPKVGLNKEQNEELQKRLADYKASLSQDELTKLVEDTNHLKDYQEEPSTKEEMESIPLLEREDISKETMPLYNDEKSIGGIKVIHHNVITNGIAYIRFLFDISRVPQDLIPYMALLSGVIGNVDTQNHKYLELSNEINIHTGGINTDVKSFSTKGTTQKYFPVFEWSTKVLYDEFNEAFSLIEEMLFRTKFADTKRIGEIIDESKSRMQMRFTSSGHVVAMDRAMSYYSAHGLFKESTSGITFYKFLEDLAGNYGDKKENLIKNFILLMQSIFAKENLLISITADEEGYRRFEDLVPTFLGTLKEKQEIALWDGFDKTIREPKCLNEGYKAAMQVQYVARAGNFFEAGYQYTGALKVLKLILSYDYLWNNVRVKGGAYGCMCGFSGVDGDGYFTSYRDPKLKETNLIYEKAAEFVRNFKAEERDMTKYIIGTISGVDTPLTPQGKGRRSLSAFLSGLTMEELELERDQILNVTQEDIRALDGIIKSITDAGNICVIGNESKVEENRDLFLEVKNLLK
ncbi:MAG: hypA [Herbinix sp.]|nr:hypA [Herbinix sp.]